MHALTFVVLAGCYFLTAFYPDAERGHLDAQSQLRTGLLRLERFSLKSQPQCSVQYTSI